MYSSMYAHLNLLLLVMYVSTNSSECVLSLGVALDIAALPVDNKVRSYPITVNSALKFNGSPDIIQQKPGYICRRCICFGSL